MIYLREYLPDLIKSGVKVSLFVDPDILTDPEMIDVKTITLSYTFFKVSDMALVEPSSPKG